MKDFRELFMKNKASSIMILVSLIGAIVYLVKGDAQRTLNFLFVGYMNLMNIRDRQITDEITQIKKNLNRYNL